MSARMITNTDLDHLDDSSPPPTGLLITGPAVHLKTVASATTSFDLQLGDPVTLPSLLFLLHLLASHLDLLAGVELRGRWRSRRRQSHPGEGEPGGGPGHTGSFQGGHPVFCHIKEAAPSHLINDVLLSQQKLSYLIKALPMVMLSFKSHDG